MNTRTLAALAVLLASFAGPARAQAPLPAGWPNRIELGMGDAAGGAAAMKATAPFGFRYQYLAGGANTGSGWATWNTNGDFARYYIEDSVANGVIPVFTYYMILQSLPGGGNEGAAVFTNLSNTATMTAYYNDLKLFFQKAGAFPTQKVVLHVEPDLWGYMQQRSTNDNAATVPVKVSETGIPQLAGLPSNMSGFARGILKLRDAYAPNVNVGYHISVWGTGNDIVLSNPSDPVVDALAGRAAAFYTSLGANYDIAFAEFSDRDSGFYQYVYGDNGQHWFDPEDFRRSARFLGGFSAAAGKRIVLWQIPLGNTKMRAENNLWGHYQDNRPEWLLDEPSRTHLAAYRDAGVVAFLFGGGGSGVTCACDGLSPPDGITNPSPINGNTVVSQAAAPGSAPVFAAGATPTLTTPYAADDDGGFFRWKAWQYYQTGAMTLPGAGTPPERPAITTQPQNQTIRAGQTATLSVAATSTFPLNYQWYAGMSGTTTSPIAGEISSSYTTPALKSSTSYWVRVSSSAGTVDSATASVVVTPKRFVSDMDGDGKTELAVFRPSNGTWYARYSAQGYSTMTADAIQWGLPGDIPISGDFDGDGKIDLTVFRPSNGTWYIRYSSLGYNIGNAGLFQWGLPGDIPLVADFDGDGKTELTIWRPSNGTWYVRYSSFGFIIGNAGVFQWGLPGDVPLTGDFDGDGKTELTIFRPVNGTWYVRYSSLGYGGGFDAFQWGLPGDLPISADVDGDGKTELTVWRPSNGTWYVRYSSLAYDIGSAGLFQWGRPGDVPLAADFDGDGKTELTIWRPSNGTWYLRYSSFGFDIGNAGEFQWGLLGDVMVK